MADKTPDDKGQRETSYQMFWDCKFCGTEKLLGVTHRHCPNCGALQDPEWRYMPPREEWIALEDHKYVGADKTCPACGQPNSAANTFCSECGADLSGADSVVIHDLAPGDDVTGTQRDVVKQKHEAEMARVAAAEPARKYMGLTLTQWAIGAGIALVALIVAGIIYAVTYRKQVTGTVTDMTWERTVEIEAFQQVAQEAWDEAVPDDAYGKTCDRKQRGEERVKVGEREVCEQQDAGDGSFREVCHDEPVYERRPTYDQWCTFTVDRWIVVRDVEASGAQREPDPHWPEFVLAAGTGGYGQEREGQKHERYAVKFREEGGKSHECSFDDEAKWAPFSLGTAVEFELYVTGGTDCGTLKLAQ